MDCFWFGSLLSGSLVFHKSHMLKLRVEPSETVMTDVLREDDNDELRRSPGTPFFTAPECCLGLTYRGRAVDMWALGVTLYFMVLSNYPFMGDTLQDTWTSMVQCGNGQQQAKNREDMISALQFKFQQVCNKNVNNQNNHNKEGYGESEVGIWDFKFRVSERVEFGSIMSFVYIVSRHLENKFMLFMSIISSNYTSIIHVLCTWEIFF